MNESVATFGNLLDLASERMGGKVLEANDEFFAPKESLLKDGRGIFIPEKFTDHGKWMDGWETRRKRSSGDQDYDYCVIRLAAPGEISAVDIDTNHFLGNHPQYAAIDGGDGTSWKEILPRSPLRPGSQNLFSIPSTEIFDTLRLRIFPDGGVARLRAYGEVRPEKKEGEQDLACVLNGGKALVCNDMFFGNMHNLLYPGRGVNMGDGWETRRKRNDRGFDWIIVRLGARGTIKRLEVDTAHFKGNYPDTCELEACLSDVDPDFEYSGWRRILPQSRLRADEIHRFEKMEEEGPFTHVRFKIYPDGGVSRLRVFGVPDS